MHEMPVVMEVVDSLDHYARENGIEEIREVTMEIGEIAMIIPRYFESFWEPVIEKSEHLRQAKLKIEVVPGIGGCRECGHQFNIEEHNGICPNCGAVEKFQILSGRDVQIREIAVL